jgi:hypothetical protein
LAAFGLAVFGAARLTGALRAGFLAGFATFLRIAGRLAGTFLRLLFAFSFFLTAMRSSRRHSPPDADGYSAPFEPRRAR